MYRNEVEIILFKNAEVILENGTKKLSVLVNGNILLFDDNINIKNVMVMGKFIK